MFFLDRIRKAQQRRQRLYDAQLMMAKAYRGVVYNKLQHEEHPVCHKTYRGATYCR